MSMVGRHRVEARRPRSPRRCRARRSGCVAWRIGALAVTFTEVRVDRVIAADMGQGIATRRDVRPHQCDGRRRRRRCSSRSPGPCRVEVAAEGDRARDEMLPFRLAFGATPDAGPM